MTSSISPYLSSSINSGGVAVETHSTDTTIQSLPSTRITTVPQESQTEDGNAIARAEKGFLTHAPRCYKHDSSMAQACGRSCEHPGSTSGNQDKYEFRSNILHQGASDGLLVLSLGLLNFVVGHASITVINQAFGNLDFSDSPGIGG
jgi:hypothetical protein